MTRMVYLVSLPMGMGRPILPVQKKLWEIPGIFRKAPLPQELCGICPCLAYRT